MLADLEDINTFLPQEKLDATDGNPEINRFQVDIDRAIKGYLSSVYSQATLTAWADPDNTPVYIRGIAGRLIAALWYASKLRTQGDWDKSYPQFIYNQGMDMLEMVRTGAVILIEVTDEVAGTAFGRAQFWPNATTAPPKFTMDMLL